MARPIDTRDALRSIRKLCRPHDIEVIEDPGSGKGSHRAIRFIGMANGEQPAHFIIADSKEISPGVQRRIVSYLGSLLNTPEAKRALVEVIIAVIRQVFGL